MKILFLSQYGDSSDICLRMSLDGNKIKLFIAYPKYKENYDGIVDKVDSWQPWVQWADCIMFDDNKLENIWRQVHRLKPCFGGSSFGAQLENDRAFAHKTMAQAGLERLESVSFNRIDQVISHLKEHKVAHVVKPQGNKVESHHTIIGEHEDGSDAIAMLERFKSLNVPVEKFEVEERKRGLEVGVSAWCAGSLGFVGPVEVNFEHKHVNERETGPLCGEAGTLMKYDTQDNPFFLKVLKPFERILKAADYRGQIDINCISTMGDDGPHYWPLEFTTRLGKPAIFISDELHITPWAKLFSDLANAKEPNLQVHYDWAVGVVRFAFGFPFPESYMKASYELPVMGIQNLDHTHLWQVKSKKGQIVTAADEGIIFTSTGRGETIMAAKERAYAADAPIFVPNSYRRFDISDKINPFSLEEHGIFPEKEPIEVP